VLGELPVERWRQPFFVVFRGEPGLDAGGVSREFFFKAISELLDPAKGVFRVVEGSTYYPNDDFVVTRALNGARTASSRSLEGCWEKHYWKATMSRRVGTPSC